MPGDKMPGDRMLSDKMPNGRMPDGKMSDDKMPETLIFDYDGTIHDTMAIYEPVFRSVFRWLTAEGHTASQDIPAERIAGWLGLNSRQMWNSFLPELPEEIREEASRRVGAGMVRLIETHHARWYRGAYEMLTRLKEDGYRMVILSNCKAAYREANWKEFRMSRWFDAFYDCETYEFAPKTEIIKHIAEDYPGAHIIIGDRRNDMDCARADGSSFIGCRYGFGQEEELSGADAVVGSPEAIRDAIGKIKTEKAKIQRTVLQN